MITFGALRQLRTTGIIVNFGRIDKTRTMFLTIIVSDTLRGEAGKSFNPEPSATALGARAMTRGDLTRPNYPASTTVHETLRRHFKP
jgi:hypothetical protein